MKNLKISIVTVCYNAVETIEKTILSVINQTYLNIEYIIIDGASKDGTIDIINKYRDSIAYFVSESDKGIYDAMNKAILVATGKWVVFMNAGDLFCDDKVVENVVENIDESATFIYGNTICDFSGIKVARSPLPLESIKNSMPFSHQSVFINTTYHKRNLYDTSYKIAADYNFFYHAYLLGKKFQYIPLNISIYEAEDGLSSRMYMLLCVECARVNGKANTFMWSVNLYLQVFWHNIKNIVKPLLPHNILKFMYNFRFNNLDKQTM